MVIEQRPNSSSSVIAVGMNLLAWQQNMQHAQSHPKLPLTNAMIKSMLHQSHDMIALLIDNAMKEVK